MPRFAPPALAASALVLALAAAHPATAQDNKIYRSTEAVTGKSLRLGVYGNVSKECTTGSLPEVKVATPPKNGSLAVKTGNLKAGTVARCPNLEVPVQGVFYQSNPKYTGADEVAYEVKHQNGRVQSLSVKIMVTGGAKPGTKPSAIDL